MITVYGANTTRADLAKVELQTPANAGSRWTPIPHRELTDTILDECHMRGWQVKEERYALGRHGADLAGALLLEGVKGVEVPTGQTLALGFLHSNARRRALQITVGSSVAVCNNGMCSGQLLMQHKHDGTFDLCDEVDAALDNYATHANTLADGVRALQRAELSPDMAGNILLTAGRKKLVCWSAIGKVDAEYRKPTFADHGKDNSWALLQAFTYAARKNINPTQQMQTYNAFRQLLPTAVGNN